MMKKIVLGLVLNAVSISVLYSQFDAQTSQYMLHPTGFNPAAVVEDPMVNVTGQHRLNWIGMPNGGTTTLFNISTPLRFGNSIQALGVSFINDKVGQFVDQEAHLQYAFKLKAGEGKLNIGLNLGFVSIGFNGDSVAAHPITIGDYHDLTADPEIPQSSVAGFSADVGVGAWYTIGKHYMGLSFSHINSPVVTWGEKTSFKPAGTMYLTGGTKIELENPNLNLRPSVLFKTDFSGWQADISMLGYYKNQYWGGLSLRTGDAVVILAGLTIAGGLAIGYSYDLPTTQIIRASSGSHELYLNYSFEVETKKSNLKFKSIRIL